MEKSQNIVKDITEKLQGKQSKAIGKTHQSPDFLFFCINHSTSLIFNINIFLNFPSPFFKSLFYSAKCLNLIISNLDSLWESKKWLRDNSSSIKRKCMFLYKVKNVYYAPSEYWNAGTVYPITIYSLYINKSGN